jgi:hypothetical protein
MSKIVAPSARRSLAFNAQCEKTIANSRHTLISNGSGDASGQKTPRAKTNVAKKALALTPEKVSEGETKKFKLNDDWDKRDGPFETSSDWLLGLYELSHNDRMQLKQSHRSAAHMGKFDPPPRKVPPSLPRTKAGFGNPKQEKCGDLAVWYANNRPGAKQRGSDYTRLTADSKRGRLLDKQLRPADSWTGVAQDPVLQTSGVRSAGSAEERRPHPAPPSSKAVLCENLQHVKKWPRPSGVPEWANFELALAMQPHPRGNWKPYCDGRPPWKSWGESYGTFALDAVIKRGILHDPVWSMENVRFSSKSVEGRRRSRSVGSLGKWHVNQVDDVPAPWMQRHPYRGQNASETELERLAKIFVLVDKDGSGAVGVHELADALLLMGVKFSAKKKDEILAEIDQNGDGEVDYDEFVTFYHKLKETMGDEGGGPFDDIQHLPVCGAWARVFHPDDWRSKEPRAVTMTGPGTCVAPVHARHRSSSPTKWDGWPKPPWKRWAEEYGIFCLDQINKRGLLRTAAMGNTVPESEAPKKKKKEGGGLYVPESQRQELPLGVTASSFLEAQAERDRLDDMRRCGVMGAHSLVQKATQQLEGRVTTATQM